VASLWLSLRLQVYGFLFEFIDISIKESMVMYNSQNVLFNVRFELMKSGISIVANNSFFLFPVISCIYHLIHSPDGCCWFS
jgi:hypothetical protein